MRQILPTIAALIIATSVTAAPPAGKASEGQPMAVDDWHKNSARTTSPRDAASGQSSGVATQDHAINEQGLPGGGSGPKTGGTVKVLTCPNKPGCPTQPD